MFPKFGASITDIEDLTNLKEITESLEELFQLENVEIMALNFIFPCIHCKAQILDNGLVSKCTNCSTEQKIRKESKQTARL